MPKTRTLKFLRLTGVLLGLSIGCAKDNDTFNSLAMNEVQPACYRELITHIEYPNDKCPLESPSSEIEPLTLQDSSQANYLNISLEEVIQIALSQAEVMNELGLSVLRQPQAVGTRFSPAIVETDPRFGVEGALSAFDTQFSLFLNSENVDRPLNQRLMIGGSNLLDQDLLGLNTQLTKTTAHGTRFALRKEINYDASNFASNLFGSSWDVNLLAIARQPLMRGAGTEINRIAGPNAVPGLPNGVLIARTRTDISLADFETSVIDYVSNVENVYWDLYFSYRNLEASKAAVAASIETWQRTKELLDAGHVGADQEAQARVQYFQFWQQAQDALAGRPLLGTRTDNGSSGGTFGTQGGVLTAERRLRLLIGLAINDGTLLRPSDEPLEAPVMFDWREASAEALQRRVELRKQRWVLKIDEMGVVAARNQILPQLDLIAGYRLRGFGHDLAKKDGLVVDFNNAYDEFFGGDYEDWQFGLQADIPLGFRQGYADVRNSQLRLTRDRRILQEQERQVLHDLSNAVAELERAEQTMRTAYNLLEAAKDQLAAISAAFDAEQTSLFVLLNVQRSRAEAEIAYFRARVEYALAVRNVHFEKGSLLDFNQIYLAEESTSILPSAQALLSDARLDCQSLNYGFRFAPPISQGAFPQHFESSQKLDTRESSPVPEPLPLPSIIPQEELSL